MDSDYVYVCYSFEAGSKLWFAHCIKVLQSQASNLQPVNVEKYYLPGGPCNVTKM